MKKRHYFCLVILIFNLIITGNVIYYYNVVEEIPDHDTSKEETALQIPASPARAKLRRKLSIGEEIYNLIKEYESDEDFNTYKTNTCKAQFSSELIDAWRGSQLNICWGPNSSIDCFWKSDHYVKSHMNLCTMENFILDTSVDKWYNVTKNFRVGNNVIARGALRSSCQPQRRLDILKEIHPTIFPTCVGAWIVDGLVTNSRERMKPEMFTQENQTSSLFLLTRWREHNIYHVFDDLIQTFVSLAVVRDKILQDISILVVDDMVEGKFYPLWEKLFNGEHSRAISRIQTNPYPKGAFINHAIFNVHGGISPISYVEVELDCVSSVIAAFSEWLRTRTGVETQETKAKRLKSRLIRHPMLANNNTLSTFNITWIGRVPDDRIGRFLENEVELFNSVKDTLISNKTEIRMKLVYLEKHSVTEIINLIDRTNLLMGMHGAGLANLLWMRRNALSPRESIVVELFSRISWTNKHYYNLAKWLDISYRSIILPDAPTYTDILYPLQTILTDYRVL